MSFLSSDVLGQLLTVLCSPLGPKPMAGLLYKSACLAALWWEHQADVRRPPGGRAVISKRRCLWVTEDCRKKKHILKLVSEGKCHLSGSDIFVDLYGF